MWDQPFDERTERALLELGRQVRAARGNAGYSQRTVEARTGIDQTTIARIENGIATGLPLRRFAILLDAIHAGVATCRPAHSPWLPGSDEWINAGPAWEESMRQTTTVREDADA